MTGTVVFSGKVVSGGQTGVDRAALDAAAAENLIRGGWCPKGRLAEDGAISEEYPLEETGTRNYAIRTRLNVRDSDGTLILNDSSELSGGTALTVKYAKSMKKPFLIVTLPGSEDRNDSIAEWLEENEITILNVAGPRESTSPGIYLKALNYLKQLFHKPSGAC